MLKIWGRLSSVNVQKVMWAVRELALPHERIEAGGQFGVIDTPEYLRMNPNGQVPVIDDGGFVLWIEMAPGIDTLRLHRDALKQHITTAPGALFSVKDRYRNCLRLNCGVAWTDTTEAAVRTLGELARKQL